MSVTVDREVAEILAEIKRRVNEAEGNSLPQTSGAENPVPSSSKPAPLSNQDYAGLPVLARAWDRLPPVVSNRTGAVARLELWIKGKLKRSFKWFTWEQVNFNAATYQTFLEVVESLNAYAQELRDTTQVLAETRKSLDAEREDLKNQRATLLQIAIQLEQIDRQHVASITQLTARLEGLSQLSKDHQGETKARLAEVVDEFRLREEKLIDEQRVCYKQLALELSESRVLQDRARRELDVRVAKLETAADLRE